MDEYCVTIYDSDDEEVLESWGPFTTSSDAKRFGERFVKLHDGGVAFRVSELLRPKNFDPDNHCMICEENSQAEIEEIESQN